MTSSQKDSFRVSCNCSSSFQDQVYGNGKRVATPVQKQFNKALNKYTEVRCTVCGKTHTTFQVL